MLAGGGAKGAYAFGCLQAFRQRGISFDAVAGASAGALNAVLWSTGRFEEGERLWKELSFSKVYPFNLFDPSRHSRMFLHIAGACYVAVRLYWESLHGCSTPLRQSFLVFNSALLLFALLSYSVLEFSLQKRGPAIDSPLWFAILPLVFFYVALYGMVRSNLNVCRFGFVSAAVATIVILVCRLLFGFYPSLGPHGGDVFIFFALVLTGIGAYFGMARVFDDRVSVLGQTGLHKSLSEVLRHPLQVPTIVALSKNVEVFDPDAPSWGGTSPGPKSSLIPNTKNKWTTEYVSINDLNRDTAVLVCLASSALPFGVVPPVRVGQEVYVDGGLTDNVPAFPFISSPEFDEIFVVILEPVKSLQTTLHKIGCDQEGWSIRDRAIRVAEFPIPGTMIIGEGTCGSPNRPPTAVPYRHPPSIPRVRLFHPKRMLGGLLGGTLNFDGKFACQLIEEGYRDTVEAIDSLEKPAECRSGPAAQSID